MRGNKAVVENDTVSKINLNTVPLIIAHPNRCSLRYSCMIHSGVELLKGYVIKEFFAVWKLGFTAQVPAMNKFLCLLWVRCGAPGG